MTIRRLLLVVALLAAAGLVPSMAEAQWCQGIDGPYWCGDPDSCLYVCGLPSSTCTTSCDSSFATNCGTFQGNPANDLDSDGVANTSDNCVCTANSGQADCDGDGAGNVCDSRNGNYVFNSEYACKSDRDEHVLYFTVEVTYEQKYVDTGSCNSPPLYDHRTYDADCFNISTHNCCELALKSLADDPICHPVGQSFCNPDTWP